jgi:hypothetical protein
MQKMQHKKYKNVDQNGQNGQNGCCPTPHCYDKVASVFSPDPLLVGYGWLVGCAV